MQAIPDLAGAAGAAQRRTEMHGTNELRTSRFAPDEREHEAVPENDSEPPWFGVRGAVEAEHVEIEPAGAIRVPHREPEVRDQHGATIGPRL